MISASTSPAAKPPRSAWPPADLYLIDAMGYIFRAFHALPRLANSRGLPTQATLGFTNMVRKLLKLAQPPHLAVVMDAPGPTFREQAYQAYKAQRPAMPEELAAQLPYIRRMAEALRLPILESPGYEADDIIGTLSRQAAERQLAVVIVSSDKDMLQLVNDQVCVLNPTRGDLLCDPAEVLKLLGVRPDQVVDLMALRGDSVDNIPGAPGIGEKGSRDLIARFGDLETLLARAPEVERKSYRDSLLEHREQILLSRDLATIHTSIPVALELEALRISTPDVEACRTLFTELEFFNLLRELPSPAAAPASAATAAPGWRRVQWSTPEELSDWLRSVANRSLAMIGSEAPSDLLPGSILSGNALSLATETEAGFLAPELLPSMLPVLAAALVHPSQAWLAHDCRRLRRQLRGWGLPAPPHASDRLLDAQLLAYLLDPTRGRYDLESLARAQWDSDWEPDAAAACALARLAPELRRQVEAAQLWPLYRDLDLPLVPVLEEMESAGVGVDLAALRVLSDELSRQCQALEAEIFSLAGTQCNLNSPKQLGELLFGKLGLPAPARRGKTKSLSTAVDVLENLAEDFPIAARLLEYRQLSKLKSTYVDALPPLVAAGSGRLHTSFSQIGTATGRLSSSNPNLQNIPIRSRLGRQIRSAFCAAPGHLLVVADYSQIELRLLAHFSQDPLLLAAYQAGGDIHRLTAAEVFGVAPAKIDDEQRRRAKAVNFGIVYGLSAFGLARQLGIPQSEAAGFIRRYFERYAGVRRYIDEQLAAARVQGSVRTLWGRVRPIPDLTSRNPAQRGFAERTAINSPLQGTAADLMRLAMLRVAARLRGGPARLLLQVHDELVIEAPATEAVEVAAAAREAMETVAELRVPLLAECCIGPNWRDLE